jgi:osmotically-inducible protein OsmY
VYVIKSDRPISVGRMIHNAIQSDKSLSQAVKLTIRVTMASGRVTLRGVVLNKPSIAYVETKARRIAGWSTPIDNRLIAIS